MYMDYAMLCKDYVMLCIDIMQCYTKIMQCYAKVCNVMQCYTFITLHNLCVTLRDLSITSIYVALVK